jgi:hypothetical protein
VSDAKERQLSLEIVGDSRAPIELPRQGAMTIGSSRERADVLLEGQGVADVHCAIGRAKGGLGPWDLGSGTARSSTASVCAQAQAGDLVLVGSRRLRVVDPVAKVAQAPRGAPAPAAAPAPVAPSAPASLRRLRRPTVPARSR